MNRLIIVGNGFDLAHGLKTSYADFIDCYLKKVVEQLKIRREELEEQKETLENKIGPIHIYEDDLLKIDWGGSCQSAIKIIDEIIARVKEEGYLVVIQNRCNVEYHSSLFERIIKDYKNKGWVDIESDYYDMLKDYTLKKRGNVKRLNEELSYIEKKLIEYLTEVEKKYLSPNPLDTSKAVIDFETEIRK